MFQNFRGREMDSGKAVASRTTRLTNSSNDGSDLDAERTTMDFPTLQDHFCLSIFPSDPFFMSKASQSRHADVILDESFLEIRAKLLEIGAALDRIDRGEGELSGAQQKLRQKIDQAIALCGTAGISRTERLQRLFSRDFDPDWRSEMKV